MQRYLLDELLNHYQVNRQMIFLSGPRQVGKTTVARMLGESFVSNQYFNWDNQTHREAILKGPEAVAGQLGLDRLQADVP